MSNLLKIEWVDLNMQTKQTMYVDYTHYAEYAEYIC